jgi:hypothetical protein
VATPRRRCGVGAGCHDDAAASPRQRYGVSIAPLLRRGGDAVAISVTKISFSIHFRAAIRCQSQRRRRRGRQRGKRRHCRRCPGEAEIADATCALDNWHALSRLSGNCGTANGDDNDNEDNDDDGEEVETRNCM